MLDILYFWRNSLKSADICDEATEEVDDAGDIVWEYMKEILL